MDCTNRDVCQQVVKGLTLNIPEYCPVRVKTVMAQCWKYLPTERCSFDNIVMLITEANDIESQPYPEIELREVISNETVNYSETVHYGQNRYIKGYEKSRLKNSE